MAVTAIAPTLSPSQRISDDGDSKGFEMFELASIYNAKFAFWLKERHASLKPKQFRELLQGQGIVRKEANKFLKLAQNAQHFSPEDLAGLGLMMFSLTAPRYSSLWEAMQDEGTLRQDVVDALKKERFPSKKASQSNPPSIWRKTRGGATRYCQIPPIHDQETGVKLDRIISSEGITPQQAIKNLVIYYESAKEAEQSPLIAETEQRTNYITADELTHQAKSDGDIEEKPASFSTEIPVTSVAPVVPEEVSEVKEAAIESHSAAPPPVVQASSDTVELSQESMAISEAPTEQSSDAPSPALSTTIEDEQTRAQAELEAYMEEQSNAIASEPQNIVSSCSVDSKNTEVEAIVKKQEESLNTVPFVEPSIEVNKSQQSSIDNTSVLNTSPPPCPQTETPLYKVVGAGNRWEGEVVKIDQPGELYSRVSCVQGNDWTNIKPQHLTPISNAEAQILMDKTTLAQRVFEEFGLAVGDTVEFTVSEAVQEDTTSRLIQKTLTGKVSQLTQLGAFIDEGVPGQSWFAFNRLKKVSSSENMISFIFERQQQLAQERVRKEIIETAKLIKQCSREIALTEEYLQKQPRHDDELAHAIHKIDTHINRRYQQLERIINFAQSNGIWLDAQALQENRLVLEPGGEDAIADYLPLPWVTSELIESQIETNPEPKETINYASLSQSLRQAQNWEQITELVQKNVNLFAVIVRDWTPEDKQVLINHASAYLQSHPKAILYHELDWLPIASLQKVFQTLSFKVRDISEGIGQAKWLEGCRFLSVSDYGKENEVWTFSSSQNQEIKAWGRDDLEVEVF